MTKKGGVYIVIAVITVGLILLMQYNKPKKINWFPSFVAQHKIPYGTLVVNEILTTNFKNQLEQVYETPFTFINQNKEVKGTYLLINDKIDLGETELNILLDWASKGNTLFIASEGFEYKLLDTLNLEQTSLYNSSDINPNFQHQLVNPKLKSTKVSFDKDYYAMVFDKIDTLKTVVLGEVHTKLDSLEIIDKKVNVIKQSFGQGTIILSTFPKAFTNYFILKDENKSYTAGLLSYLKPTNKIFVDNHHKSGKSFYTSPMYIFLNTKELKWAYYIALIGCLIYVIFEGKRKQRPIAVIPPLKNQTLAFTRTIADMYYETGQQKEITKHQIANFLDYVRTNFYLKTNEFDEHFFTSLASRSYHTKEEIKSLFKYIRYIESQSVLNNSQLQTLSKKIETFKARANGK
ncbi:DUF4350 domain-containing protein [Croceitalea sp. P059]|uniref:DUF4350 domain-containing protein n=1 Tax=Croceitalea sp. P059 TaxID=3075601 RepID=UPI002885BAF2|nr:DUF4350 domain-containing protein [Croceitalea sp. P059]MDT0540859.1 DUF4350 domain-containing protein [Croceitalea sp. P059]